MAKMAASLQTLLGKLREERGYSTEGVITIVLLGIFALGAAAAFTGWGESFITDLTSR